MKKVIIAFVVTFVSLAVIAAILTWGFKISIEEPQFKILAFMIMIGVPFAVYFKDKR